MLPGCFVFEALPVPCTLFVTETCLMTFVCSPGCTSEWKVIAICCLTARDIYGIQSALFCFIKFVCSWSYKSSRRSRWYAVKRFPTLWRTAFVDAIAASRSNQRANWSVDWNATKLRPHQHCKLFAESQRWLCDVFLYRPMIESELSAGLSRWYFFTAQHCLVERKKRSESEMWWRYNGVLHRSAQNYWPLCRFSLYPTHLPQHPHSSAVHQARLSGSWIVNGCVVWLLSCFTDSVAFSLNEKWEVWPPALALINQCR